MVKETYLTVSQAAERLNVTEFSVRQYIKKGLLNATKQAKGLKFYYLISETELKIFANQHNINK